MSQTSNVQSRSGPGYSIWLAVITLVVIYSGYRHFADKANYDAGHRAYLALECSESISHLDKVTNAWWLVDTGGNAVAAHNERAECVSLQFAEEKQRAGDLSGVLLIFNDFIHTYANSALTEVVQSQVETIFTQTAITDLADKKLCDQAESLATDSGFSQLN